jgi:rubrerythrin
MNHWTLDDIDWAKFDPARVDPDMLRVVKAAAMVEHNACDYAAYLQNVFHDDPEFQEIARQWADEEVRHGEALGRWAELADPSFDFQAAFQRFTEGYRLPQDVDKSVRGSRAGELIARCIVEMGTSTYYTALADAADEPVLKEICKRIAADEFRHYRLFLKRSRPYQEVDRLSLARRLRIAVGRVIEAEDDELCYAYHVANFGDAPYRRKESARAYSGLACGYYRPWHVERMIAMLFKAVGLKPHGRLNLLLAGWAWRVMRRHNRRFAATPA